MLQLPICVNKHASLDQPNKAIKGPLAFSSSSSIYSLSPAATMPHAEKHKSLERKTHDHRFKLTCRGNASDDNPSTHPKRREEDPSNNLQNASTQPHLLISQPESRPSSTSTPSKPPSIPALNIPSSRIQKPGAMPSPAESPPPQILNLTISARNQKAINRFTCPPTSPPSPAIF